MLVKVNPSSKVVGDLALALVGAGISAEEFAADPARYDVHDSVIGFLRGELGDPAGGWPEPLHTLALDRRGPAKPETPLPLEDEAVLAQPGGKRQATLNRLLFPRPTNEFEAHRELYGDRAGNKTRHSKNPTTRSANCSTVAKKTGLWGRQTRHT